MAFIMDYNVVLDQMIKNPPAMQEWKWSEVTQSCPTLCDPMDCSLPGSSVHGILQTRILERFAISFSRGSSRPKDRTQVSRIVGRCFIVWATDLGSIHELGGSLGEGNGYPLQYSGLENSTDGGAWQATVHGVAESQTWLRNFYLLTHSSLSHYLALFPRQ